MYTFKFNLYYWLHFFFIATLDHLQSILLPNKYPWIVLLMPATNMIFLKTETEKLIRMLKNLALFMSCYIYIYIYNTLSGAIGKVVASHAAVARSIPAEVALIYSMHEAVREYCPWGWGVRPVNSIYCLWCHCP